jgi:hypothetical protein
MLHIATMTLKFETDLWTIFIGSLYTRLHRFWWTELIETWTIYISGLGYNCHCPIDRYGGLLV